MSAIPILRLNRPQAMMQRVNGPFELGVETIQLDSYDRLEPAERVPFGDDRLRRALLDEALSVREDHVHASMAGDGPCRTNDLHWLVPKAGAAHERETPRAWTASA